MCDNTATVVYLNKSSGNRCAAMGRITEHIHKWLLNRKIMLSAQYLPGEENTLADFDSRQAPDRKDWKLRPDLFAILDKLWGPHTIDLFASPVNAHLPRFAT